MNRKFMTLRERMVFDALDEKVPMNTEGLELATGLTGVTVWLLLQSLARGRGARPEGHGWVRLPE